MIDLGGDVCGNGISKLVVTTLSAVAENERDRIREPIRDVKRNLAAQGVYNGGRKPFGSDVVDGLVERGQDAQAIGKQPGTVKRIIDRMAACRRVIRTARPVRRRICSGGFYLTARSSVTT